jgi:hypothetical protein
MKKALLFASAFLVSVSITSYLAETKSLFHRNNSEVQGVGDDDGYYQWEQRRLADPSTGKIPNNIRAKELEFAATLPSDANTATERTESSGWAPRGAWNVGGRTRAFEADVNNEGILLAGTTSGGMWRSTDTGKTWILTTPLATQQGVCCVAQDTRNGHSNIWYYGSGEAYGASASATGAYFFGDGMFRSTDNGQTWKSLTATVYNHTAFGSLWQAIWGVAINPTSPDSVSSVYVATVGMIAHSSDTGNHWTALLGGSLVSFSYYTDVRVSDSGIVYATLSSDGPSKGIWRSSNGITFTNIMPAGFPTTYNRMVIGISKKDPKQVYILANTPGFGMPDTNFLGQVEWNSLWKYKYISGNGSGAGGEWFDLSANLPSRGGKFDKYNCQTSYDMFVNFLPTDTATVFIGGTDIFRSTTGFFDTTHSAHIGGYMIGASLPSIKVYPNHHPDQHVIFFSKSNPYVMYSSNDGGVFKTRNDTAANVTWIPLDNGYTTTMFYTVASDHYRPGGQLLIGGAQDNNSLFDNSPLQNNIWTKPIFGDGSFCAIADTGTVFYYSSQQGKMFKAQMDTLNGTIIDFRRIDPIGGKGYQFVNPYVLDPNNNHVMYLAGGKYLWRNNDLSGIPFSNQWDSINTNWVRFTDSVPNVGSTITAVAVSGNPANVVYYGTDQMRVYKVVNANVGNPIPTDITGYVSPNKFPLGAYVSCIAVDPSNGNNLIVICSNYFANYSYENIFYSTNGGTSWTKEGGNLDKVNGPSLRWVAFQHLKTGNTLYWLGTSIGLYAADTLKGDSTKWVGQGANTIGNAVCDMVDVRQADGLVAVATHAHGIFTYNVTGINQVTLVHDLPVAASGQDMNIYPNPATDRASVSFSLQKDEEVCLRIFDEQGRLVQQITEGKMTTGNHVLTFDASTRTSGIYFCSLETGGTVTTRRLVVVK